MAEIGGTGGISQAALDAVAAGVPLPSSLIPVIEATGGNVGNNAGKFSMEGHAHPRLTSTTYATLAADGTATITFTRSFTNKPGFSITEIDSTGSQPLVCVVQSFVGTGPYTGCVIKGYRSQTMPTQTQLSVASLLTGVITALNSLAASITGFNIFGGSASGASVSVVAIARSDVAAT